MSIENASYWTKRDAELDESAKVEKLDREQWLQRRDDVLTSKIAYADDNLMANDIIGWRAELEQVQAELAQIRTARFDAEWTKDVTQQRREEWNRRARAGEFNDAKGNIVPLKVRDAERAQGWYTQSLKAAIKRHNL